MILNFKKLAESHDIVKIIKELYNVLTAYGFSKKWYSPTYQAPDLYKKALVLEDLCYRFFYTNEGLLFKETSCIKKYQHKESSIDEVFNNLIMGSEVNAMTFYNLVGKELVISLQEYELIAIDDNSIQFMFRLIPTPVGAIVSDPCDLQDKSTIHIGLDSVLFFNFLKKMLACRQNISSLLELGCGTGIHSLLLKEMVAIKNVFLRDINHRAIACAKLNCQINNSNNTSYECESWFNGIEPGKQYDIILCNPPFEWRFGKEKINSSIAAFDGDKYGLGHTLDVLKNSISYLSKNGSIFVMTQVLIDAKGVLNLLDLDEELKNKIASSLCSLELNILYEHLLVSEEMMKNILEHNFRNLALVAVEVRNDGRGDYRQVDQRPFLKRISDKKRVNRCHAYWREHFAE